MSIASLNAMKGDIQNYFDKPLGKIKGNIMSFSSQRIIFTLPITTFPKVISKAFDLPKK